MPWHVEFGPYAELMKMLDAPRFSIVTLQFVDGGEMLWDSLCDTLVDCERLSCDAEYDCEAESLLLSWLTLWDCEKESEPQPSHGHTSVGFGQPCSELSSDMP
jgi:hypothetical protein